MYIAVVNLTGGGFSGGYRKYLEELIPRLRNDARVSRVEVYSGKTWPNADYWRLSKELAATKPDVVFVPTGQTIDCGRPTVSMIHNMEPLRVPFDGNSWREGLRNLARAWAARRAVRRSDRVIAVSKHVRDFLVTRWHIPEQKIGVIYLGVERVADRRRPSAASDIAPGSFLFTAGSIRPARGLDDLLVALAEVPMPLLIAGEADAGTRRHAEQLRRRAAGLPIIWLGQRDRQEMAWCFANCRAFIMTSRAEACPNTVLEAMAHGAVSISTDCPPMPEFFADGAMYYRARDGRDLAARLRILQEMPVSEQTALREHARARARHFTWDRTAAETVTQLELAMA